MELSVGSYYSVSVVRLINSGAIVELEDGSTQLIHISNISNKYVSNISDFVSVGNTYSALAINGKVKPIELSLAHLDLGPKPVRDNVRGDKRRPAVKHTTYKPSLDEMIAKSEGSYEDKFGKRRVSGGEGRRPRRRR